MVTQSLIYDERVPSRRAWVAIRGADPLKVPDEIRKCVAFIAYQRTGGDIRLAGTAFLVSEPIPDTRAFYTWVATAAHVINGVRAKSADGRVRVRLNLRDGGTDWFSMSVDDWALHPTDDVAAAGIDLTGNRFDHLTWPIGDDDVLGDSQIAEEGIGVGDDLFFPGLFVHHPGLDRNVPIVRIGNIAAMPGEPLHVAYWGNMVAYLIEARSIGGLSGSPVFVHLGIVKLVDGELKYFKGSKHGRYRLLGIMSGHYPGEIAEADESLYVERGKVLEEESQVNMGIGIVVPIQRLMEVIKRPELDAMKAEQREEILIQESGNAVADSADVPLQVSTTETPMTKQDFEQALRKVSRKTSSADKD